MAATGLEVFDRTLQTTNIWLDEIMERIGPDRQAAWHVLGAVLHVLRDRLPLELAVHLGAARRASARATSSWRVWRRGCAACGRSSRRMPRAPCSIRCRIDLTRG